MRLSRPAVRMLRRRMLAPLDSWILVSGEAELADDSIRVGKPSREAAIAAGLIMAAPNFA